MAARLINYSLTAKATTPLRPSGHDNLQYQITDMIYRWMAEFVYGKYQIATLRRHIRLVSSQWVF